MTVFGRLCPTFLWCLATLMTGSKGFREIICGAKTVPIGCDGDKGIAIKRLYGCDDCLGDRCSESFLDKENIDRVWSRCNLSSSCDIEPARIKDGQGLGVEYHCAGNVTGCYDDDISLYCQGQQTIHLTKFYQLSCCQEFGSCLPKETKVLFGSARGRDISLACQGKQTCSKRVQETALRVHYICKDQTTIPPHTPVEVVEETTLSSTVIIVIIACVFGVTILLIINFTIAVFCGPKKTSYVVTPRKPSSNHILDNPANDVTKWSTVKAQDARKKETMKDGTGMKENDLYQASDFRGHGYLSLKENDLYQGLDEFKGQMSNQFPECQMKDNVIYQAFDDALSPAGENGSRDLGQCQGQINDNDLNLYEGVDDLEQVKEIIHLPGYKIQAGKDRSAIAVHLPAYKTLEVQGQRAESDLDGMKENELYCPIPRL